MNPMSELFKPALKPHELPRDTLVDLWHRTADAHENLCAVWFDAVSARYGAEVAEAIALEGWPLRRIGATPRELERVRDENLVAILLSLKGQNWGAGRVLREHQAQPADG